MNRITKEEYVKYLLTRWKIKKKKEEIDFLKWWMYIMKEMEETKEKENELGGWASADSEWEIPWEYSEDIEC